MLELRRYPKGDMVAMFGTRNTEGLKRKLRGYGVDFETSGWGDSLTFEIKEIKDPFKVFAITELGVDAGTDFKKMRNFYYYYFNDETFMARPDEVKEVWMAKEGNKVSRQTIASYTQKLVSHNMIEKNTRNYIYYFAYKDTQEITTRERYLEAWHDYWGDISNGYCSFDAIWNMRANYGGVARKQAIPEVNGIYNEKIEQMLSYIQKSIENEMEG